MKRNETHAHRTPQCSLGEEGAYFTYPPFTLSASVRLFHSAPSILPCSGTAYFLPAAWRQRRSCHWQNEQGSAHP
jgi:hypothetical protein